MSFVTVCRSCADVWYVVKTVSMSETKIVYRRGSEGVDVSGNKTKMHNYIMHLCSSLVRSVCVLTRGHGVLHINN